jgi:PhzF family phenazine biosynthesis protein
MHLHDHRRLCRRLVLRLPERGLKLESVNSLDRQEPQRSSGVAEALGVTATDIQRAAIIDVGPVWFTVQLASGDAVRALAPEMGKLAALSSIGITGANVFGLYRESANTDLVVRSFASGDGIPEDPVCGSGNGCVAALYVGMVS